LQCEVCGRQIFGIPIRAIIEGAKMTVCEKCEKLGSGYWEPRPQLRPKKNVKFQPLKAFTKRKPKTFVTETLELVANLGEIVREARRNLGMSHDDLGKKIREKVSVLRKIENGKMVPDLGLAKKLEHALKIKLLVPTSEPKTQLDSSSKPQATTLGDIIKFKLKQKEVEK
jgi:putative transcription factor